jgi:hypothetical protein
MAGSRTNLFAGADFLGVFRSTDGGATWTAVNSGLPTPSPAYVFSILSLAISGTNLFAATNGYGVYLSTDDGTSWTSANSGLSGFYVNALAIGPVGSPAVFAGTNEGVFRSTDNGLSWDSSGLANTTVSALAVIPGPNPEIFASAVKNSGIIILPLGTESKSTASAEDSTGVFRSTDNGASWTIVDSGLATVPYCFTVSGTNLFAAGYGIFLSTNSGTTWIEVDSGLANRNILSLAVSGDRLYAGTNGSGVWRRPLSEMITAVRDKGNDSPSKFTLSQNYPNPCNPTTAISFSLPSRSMVSLKVFDILGREVSTIVSEELQAGSYTRQWNASAFASGVYFYRLQAGTYSETKRLLLLK